MLRLAAVLVVCLCAACGPTDPRKQTPTPVSPSALVDHYRDDPWSAENSRTNRRVVMTLSAHSYSVSTDAVGWLTGAPGSPPAVVFSGVVLPDSLKAVEITGTCRGIVRDGRRRGFNVDFYVLVVDCEFRIAP